MGKEGEKGERERGRAVLFAHIMSCSTFMVESPIEGLNESRSNISKT